MNPSEPVNPELETTAGAPVNPETETHVAPVLPEATPPPKIIGYCRECGKALDETNVAEAPGQGMTAIYCEEHRPPQQAQAWTTSPPMPQQPPPFAYTAAPGTSPYTAPPNTSPYTAPPYHASQPPPLPSSSPLHAGGSPGLAFVLGMIPGVGAVYNGQYAKGLMHVILFGLAISLAHSGTSNFEPLFGLMITCFWFYMAFEAYHTAKKRQASLPVDEFSSVFPLHGGAARAPVGPIVLIALGVLFLLSNLEIIEMRKLLRFWPALLIVMGVYMIYARLTVPAEGKHDGQ